MQKELHQVSFLCISRTTTSLHFFGWLHCSCKKVSTTTKSETKIFKQKDFIKKLVQSQREQNSGIFRLNKIISKLLTISKCLQLNCYQIQQLLAIVENCMVNKKHCFENAERFHISHFTYHLSYYIIIIINHR